MIGLISGRDPTEHHDPTAKLLVQIQIFFFKWSDPDEILLAIFIDQSHNKVPL